MVQVRYTGCSKQDFEELRPALEKLQRMAAKCRPFGPDYHAVDDVAEALVRACIHFTGNPSIYHKAWHSTGSGMPPAPPKD